MRSNSICSERRAGAVRLVSLTGLVVALSALVIAMHTAPALAANNASQRVALIPAAGPIPTQGPNGIMPTSSYVSGKPSETFSGFSFSNLALDQVTSANLAKYDTAVLVQVHSSSLSAAAQAALAQFVANGGKLIIHDSDETNGNDYSWLLGGAFTTNVGTGCINCGSQSGRSTVTTNSGIISAAPADRSFVDLAQLDQFTDQGDANLLVSTDPRWNTLVQGTNGNGDSGAEVAYARNKNGLIIYNGFDTDFIKSSPTQPWRCESPNTGFSCPGVQPTVDWLAHMWFSELAQGWGQAGQPGGGAPGLPPGAPVVGIGTPVSPETAGLPSQVRSCVARKSLRLRLKRFAHMRHRKIVQVDVYVNRKHVIRERHHFGDRTLRHLPRHKRYTVTVVGTTSRGYHLIAKRRYRAC
jgi:hypothetical protein